MIISPGRQFIFAHMPKTGGTSFATALEARAHKDDILIGDTPKALKRKRRLKGLEPAGRLWKHSTLADVEGIVSRENMQDWFVVTLVRNPWDRVVSYYHWLQDQSFQHPVVGIAQTATFADFAQNDLVLRGLAANTAANFTTDSTGRDHVTLAARLERFDEDIRPFEDHLGFQIDLPHLNRSERAEGYVDYYDSVTRQRIETACQDDIDRFGYRFGD